MHILRWNELQAVPWKNGLGITRELAKAPRAEGFDWRLSIADVTRDGPFSRFEGMQRILTVLQGKGMELIGPQAILQADPDVPVAFDGALEITGRLKDGPLRDFNLIFDPRHFSAQANVLAGGESRSLRPADGQVCALHCIEGLVSLQGSEKLLKGDTLLLERGTCPWQLGEASKALVVSITALA